MLRLTKPELNQVSNFDVICIIFLKYNINTRKYKIIHLWKYYFDVSVLIQGDSKLMIQLFYHINIQN